MKPRRLALTLTLSLGVFSCLWADYAYSGLLINSPENKINTKASASDTTPFFLPGPSNKLKNSMLSDTASENGQLKDFAPIADAGPDQIISEGETVTLNGSRSIDPDGILLSYSWKQAPINPSITLSGADTAVWTFTAPSVSTDTIFPFELRVTDNKGLNGTDSTNIVIKDTSSSSSASTFDPSGSNSTDLSSDRSLAPSPPFTPSPSNYSTDNHTPVADAGPDKVIEDNSVITLDGTKSSDLDHLDSLTYSWVQTAGNPLVSLTAANTAIFTFPAPNVFDDSVLTFELTVSDSKNASDTDTVDITVKNVDRKDDIMDQTPVANAGQDQKVSEDEEVTLDGGASNASNDSSEIDYLWTQIDGQSVDLEDADTANAKFEAPRIEEVDGVTTLTFMLTLEVSDGHVDTDTVNITVQEDDQSTDTEDDSNED